MVVDQETPGRRGILGCLALFLNCFKIMLLFFFLGGLPDDRVWIILLLWLFHVCLAKVSLKSLLSHVVCGSHDLDCRPLRRPVVLYARRCIFGFPFSPSDGARSLREQGRWRHEEDPAICSW